jgi:hypothetical protein
MKHAILITLLLVAGCTSATHPPSMSKAEAMRVLESQDPNSKDAILALQEHAKLEYQAHQKEREAHLQAGEPVAPSTFASERTGINQSQEGLPTNKSTLSPGSPAQRDL